MVISFERTDKNQLQPSQESMGYAPMLSHCSLLRNPWPKTDRCAGALSWRRNELLVLHFSGRFLLPTSLRRRRMLMYSYLFTVIISHVLYQRIPGKYRSYYVYPSVYCMDLIIILFTLHSETRIARTRLLKYRK